MDDRQRQALIEVRRGLLALVKAIEIWLGMTGDHTKTRT